MVFFVRATLTISEEIKFSGVILVENDGVDLREMFLSRIFLWRDEVKDLASRLVAGTPSPSRWERDNIVCLFLFFWSAFKFPSRKFSIKKLQDCHCARRGERCLRLKNKEMLVAAYFHHDQGMVFGLPIRVLINSSSS